jgi:GT2 family glycosyltransferase
MVDSVDVVILSWNRIDDTVECLEGLFRQQRIIANITLVDQGSHLETLRRLRKYQSRDASVRLIEVGRNVGVAAGRNIGMRAGNAAIIMSIDNDAIFASSTALYDAVKRFQDSPAIGALGFRVETDKLGELDLGSWVYPKSLLRRQYEPFLATRFCGAGHAIRRSAYEKTAGYDERLFFYWEELDLSYQLIQNGYSISYEPSVFVRHKVSAQKRTNWQDKRFYYLVRNALYLDWKYFGSRSKLAALAAGYLIKGSYNRVIKQAVAGIRDGLRMAGKLSAADRVILSPTAMAYIQANDLRHRGNILQRVKREVLTPLPRS